MRILGIETSCDETAIAIIDVLGSAKKPRARVLSNVIASQVKLHAKFGGVVPNLARREHQKNLVPVLFMALKSADLLQPRRASAYTYDRKYKRRMEIQMQGILSREPDLFARLAAAMSEPRPRRGALAKRARIREGLLTLRIPNVDAIAVTVGPGLAPALWVGVNFTKALACLWGKPVIPVNHLEGHIYTNLLPANWAISNLKFPRPRPGSAEGGLISKLEFPALCLIVSGGHTELVFMSGYGKYRVIGETLDDAAGEAFDKVAKMLGLGFPGGPIISRLAELGNPRAINFPRPMLHSKDFNFSFSGLKTAVLYKLREKLRDKEIKKLSTGRHNKFLSFLVSDFCASFEQAVTDVLVAKTVRAAKQYRVKAVMIGGGVAANKKLRRELGAALKKALLGTRYLLPDTRLTGDNALMIALAGYFNRQKKTARWASIRADANLRLDRAKC